MRAQTSQREYDPVTILDTTLRDGAQAEGITYSLSDKLHIAAMLDSLAIHYIEAGNPYSNPKDIALFENIAMKNARCVAFCATRRKDTVAEEDEGLLTTLNTGVGTVALFGKASVMHVDEILKTSREENLSMIADSVSLICKKGVDVIFDAEHFFDGYKLDKGYAMETLSHAHGAGAQILCLCDTNGATFPQEIFEITEEVVKQFPSAVIGIHAHDDCGMAVANSIMAYTAGARHIQGTLLGMGERCGNASLSAIIPNLQLKLGVPCIPEECLGRLTGAVRYLSEISNVYLPHNMPYVGKSAFAHKAGMHAAGVLKNSASFEHVNPKLVGNERKILVSEMAGKSTLFSKLSEVFPEISAKQAEELLFEIKQRERQGFAYEASDASFIVLARKLLFQYPPFYSLINFKIINEQPAKKGTSAMAVVKISVGDQYELSCAEGLGPVNAMDKALRSALTTFYPCLEHMRLIDFKVRVLDTKVGTDAVVRVLIESTDGVNTWTTVGVSADIIEASFMALSDSIEYMLLSEVK